MTVLLDQFVETLSQSGLMTAGDVQAFLDGLPAGEKPETGEELARLLVRHGKLTKFQAQCIYQGKTKGLVLGNYVVLDSIGAGGMGHVYKARHRRMKRVVALKVLPSSVTKRRDAVERFQREVEAAARLVHQNIVVAHDADEADGLHFLVMEFVEGRDLAKTVKHRGPLPAAKAIDYVLQAARGLEYAHGQGIVHRDIKPSNLVLDKSEDGSETVKILDMGLARFEQEVGPDASTAAATLTQSGQVMGTIDYLPPEQAEDTHRVDYRADVYSLGCTLFYLLTGRPVYAGDTAMTKMLAHREAPVPSLSEARQEVPEQLDQVFQKMVAKRPDDRHPSMGHVIAELEACHASLVSQVTDTLSFTQGPTGGDETGADLAQLAPGRKPTADDSALDEWLKAELPAMPTQLRTKPAKKLQLTKQQMLYSTVAGALCLAVLLIFTVVIVIRTPRGTILVHVNQPDAQVSVDAGKVTLTAPGDQQPVQLEVAEGEHTLKVTKGGFETHTKTFTIKSGGKEVFNVNLVPLVAAKAQRAKVKPTRQRDAAAWTAILPADAPAAAMAPFDATQGKKHQQTWADYLGLSVEQAVDLGDGVKLTLVLIPPGEFLMGSTAEEQARFLEEAQAAKDQWAIGRIPSEGPQHRVRITRPFGLGRHEVTRGQFRRFVEETGYKTEAEQDGKGGWGSVDGKGVEDPRFVWSADLGFPQTDDHPVVNVSSNDATAFCQWLSKKQGVKYDLPTEAQWEYACRAGTTTFWHCGDSDTTLQAYVWFDVNSSGKTHPAGQLKPNAWALYDMHGNVWEWCADRYAANYYAQSPPNDPSGPTTGSHRVRRGGSWVRHAGYCRSAIRLDISPDYRHDDLGFRLASVLADE